MATLAPTKPATASLPAAPATASRLRAPSLDTLFTAVFALFGWGIGLDRLSDNSFMWHLRTGELILDSGIPHSDVFSFTAKGTPWVAQSWLAEVLYGALDRAVGPFGIRLLGAVLGATVAVLVFRLALRLTRERVRAALLSVAALAGVTTVWSERPLVLGVLFLLLVVWVVEVPDSWLGRRPVLILPVLFWPFANVHGSFALGFAYLGLHLVGRWLDGRRPWEGRERSLLTGTALAFLVLFVNPYGVSLVTFPIDLLGRGDVLRDVVEWSSPSFHTIYGQAYAIWIVAFAVVLARGPHRASRRDLVVAIPFLLLGLWALRNIAVAPLVCLPIAARCVAVERRPAGERGPRLGWAVVGVLAVLAAAMGVRAAGNADFRLRTYPVRAMAAVEEQGLLGRRLLADDADGGYIILRYWPEQRVFFDDRFDMYPRDVIDDFATVSNARSGWARVLEERDVEVVVWERDRQLTQLLRLDDRWEITYRDRDYVVFVRADVEPD